MIKIEHNDEDNFDELNGLITLGIVFIAIILGILFI